MVDAESGQPIPGVRVIGWWNTFDAGRMGRREFAESADGGGRFQIAVPARVPLDNYRIDGEGWQVMRWHVGDDPKDQRLHTEGGAENRVTLPVRRTFHLCGIVVDAGGAPLAGASIEYAVPMPFLAQLNIGTIRVSTDKEGGFDIGPFAEDAHAGLDPSHFESVDHWRDIAFLREGLATARLDPRSVAVEDRARVRVILGRGFTLEGVLVDVRGNPLADVVVAAERGADVYMRRAVRTDSDGRWRLERLLPGTFSLVARAFARDLKARREVVIDSDASNLRLVAEPIRLTRPPQTTVVLGMTLADVDDELRAAYEVPEFVSVLIIDPGKDSAALGIGRLECGYGLWDVGEKSVTSVRDFVERLIQGTSGEPARDGPLMVRVVYTFWNERAEGTSTQYVRPSPEQVVELKALRDRLAEGR